MRDLEIRGAGDLLGAEQSGHVAALGFELYVELLAEAVAELSGERRPAARPVRVDAQRRRLRAGAVHRGRGAEDRPPPAARADGDRGRAARAAGRDRGSLRPAARAGREPVRDPGGEAEARHRRAPTTSSSAAARPRSARCCSARASCARCARELDTAVYTSAKREVSLRSDEFSSAVRLSRCYTRRAPGSVSKTAAAGAFSMRATRTDRLCAALVLAGRGLRRRRRAGRCPSDSVAVVGDQQISKADWDALIDADQAQLHRAPSAPFPKPGTVDLGEPEDERDAVPDPEQRVRAGGREARRQGQRQGHRRAAATRSRSSTTATPPGQKQATQARWTSATRPR